MKDFMVAILPLFRKPSNPAIPLEPLQSERVLRKNRDSGWRRMMLGNKKPIPDEEDGSSLKIYE